MMVSPKNIKVIETTNNKENETINEEKLPMEDFVIVEDDDKVNKNRFFNCCGRIRKKNSDEELNNNIKNLKNFKNKENKKNIQTCNSNNDDKVINVEQDNDLNNDNEKDEILNKAEEGCAECGAGCSKVCNCIGFFIVRWFNSFKESCKNCFGCSDKKDK